jgi:hypothetical protein
MDGKNRNAYKILSVKLKGKRLFGRPVNMWKNNIKFGLSEMDLRCLLSW